MTATGYSDLVHHLQDSGELENFRNSQDPIKFLIDLPYNLPANFSDFNDCINPTFALALVRHYKVNIDELKTEITQIEPSARTPLQTLLAKKWNLKYIASANRQTMANELTKKFDISVFTVNDLKDFKGIFMRGATANMMEKDWYRRDDYKFLNGSVLRSNVTIYICFNVLVYIFKLFKDNHLFAFDLARQTKPGLFTAYTQNYYYNADLFDRFLEIILSIYQNIKTRVANVAMRQGDIHEFHEKPDLEAIMRSNQTKPQDQQYITPELTDYITQKNAANNLQPIFTNQTQITNYFNEHLEDKELYERTIENLLACNLTLHDNKEFSYDRLEQTVRYKYSYVGLIYRYGRAGKRTSEESVPNFIRNIMTEKYVLSTIGSFLTHYTDLDLDKESHSELLRMKIDNIPRTMRQNLLRQCPGNTQVSMIVFIYSVCDDNLEGLFGPDTMAFIHYILLCNLYNQPASTFIMNELWKSEDNLSSDLLRKLNIIIKIILSNGDKENLSTNYNMITRLFVAETFSNMAMISTSLNNELRSTTVTPDGKPFEQGDEILTRDEVIYFMRWTIYDSIHYSQHHYHDQFYNNLSERGKQILTNGLGLNYEGWRHNELLDNPTNDQLQIQESNHHAQPIPSIDVNCKRRLIRYLATFKIDYPKMTDSYTRQLADLNKEPYTYIRRLVGRGYGNQGSVHDTGSDRSESIFDDGIPTDNEYSEEESDIFDV